MRAVVLFVFCYQNIVICEYRTTLFVFCVCVSCRSYTLNTNSLSIMCIFICAPCFYHVATAIRHFTTDSWCICLIHLCKVVFKNFAPPPAVKSHFNHWWYCLCSKLVLCGESSACRGWLRLSSELRIIRCENFYRREREFHSKTWRDWEWLWIALRMGRKLGIVMRKWEGWDIGNQKPISGDLRLVCIKLRLLILTNNEKLDSSC